MSKRKEKLKGISHEQGNALVSLAFSIVVLMALALPAYEVGRALNDRISCASAAEDAAKAIAANPSMTQADLNRYILNTYPQIAADSTVKATIGGQKILPYTHRLSDGEGGFRNRASKATSSSVAVKVVVSKDFVTAAGSFIAAATGASGYTVAGTGHASIDETVASGRW